MTGRGPRVRRRGMLLYVLVFVFVIAFTLCYAVYNYLLDEYHRVHRSYYGEVAVKLAEAAEAEALAWFRLQSSLLPGDPAQAPFVRALFFEPSDAALGSLEQDLLAEGCLPGTLSLVAGLPRGVVVEACTLSYRDVRKYFVAQPDQPGPLTGRVEPDPYERYGMLEVAVSVRYGRVLKSYRCRRDLKVVSDLPPVVTKFTLFARSVNGDANIQSMPPAQIVSAVYTNQGFQPPEFFGLIDPTQVAPLVLIHHPEDVKRKDGYVETHGEICQYQAWEPPYDQDSIAQPGAVLSAPSVPYRPNLLRRGWVFLGRQAAGDDWHVLLNTTPGLINPGNAQLADVAHQLSGFGTKYFYTETPHLYLGEGYQMHESELDGFSFVPSGSYGGARPRFDTDGDGFEEVAEYRGILFHCGMVRPYEGDAPGYFRFRNYVAGLAGGAASLSFAPSVLHLSGDMQIASLEEGPEGGDRPASYLDRRSPTLVLGPVLRRYLHSGLVMMTVRHPVSGQNRFGDAADLPFFWSLGPGKGGVYDRGGDVFGFDGPWTDSEGDLRGKLGSCNVKFADGTSVALGPVDVRTDVFGAASGPGAAAKCMSTIYTHTYNWVYDRVVNNARLLDATQLTLPAVPSLTLMSGEPSSAEAFFYGPGDPTAPAEAGCSTGTNLRLRQFTEGGPGAYRPATDIFPTGMFCGNLGSLVLSQPSLTAAALRDPARGPGAAFDLRLKAVCIFEDQQAFIRAHFLEPEAGWTPELRHSPLVSYVQGPLDLTRVGGLSPGTPLVFAEGGLVIADGDIVLPRIQRHPAVLPGGRPETLTFVSCTGSIRVETAEPVDAALVALGPGGTVQRGDDLLHVRGSVAVDRLEVDPARGGSLFAPQPWLTGEARADQPTGRDGLMGYRRNLIEYDPALEPTEVRSYQGHYRVALAEVARFFKVEE